MRAKGDVLDLFHPAVRTWFQETFSEPTRAQRLAFPEIVGRRSTLLLAPTGSGKTLAAFLAALERLFFAPVPHKARRCRVLYISPLRALAVDVERNLRAPLLGIAAAAQRRGDPVHVPEAAIRTGDTPASERGRISRNPPDILITTPESLYLVLSSRAREMLSSVEVVIVDEIHALVGTKRGAHLALSLERVQELAGGSLQRIGLSATQRPLDVVARFLGGGTGGASWRPRPVAVVDAGARKAFDLRVEVPVDDMARLAPPPDQETPRGSGTPRGSIWPAIHPRLLELIRAHRTTIIFVNNRRLAERLAAALNELASEDLARAHHGSVAREQRLAVEEALKAGQLRALVATSSLELGIDMGTVDLVVQIEAPPSVASGIQRIGRASHQAEAVSRGILVPKHRADLLATAAVTKAMEEGAVEETRIPSNPLDVLAQHLVSLVALSERRVDDLFTLVRRAAPYASLPREHFDGVLDMLSGRYPAHEFSELRPRVTWDRRRGLVRAREGARQLVVSNAGTIPDRGLYGVFLAGSESRGGRRVGELDEEMVFESTEGEVFVLGASSWRILEISRDRVLVEPAPGQPGKMPFWKADRPARPVELGRTIGRLLRELATLPRDEAFAKLETEHHLDSGAAKNLLAYIEEQKAALGAVPDERTIILERTRDEMGDFRLCVLSPLGGRLTAPWALAIKATLRERGFPEVEALWNDDGIVIRLPDCDRPPNAQDLLPQPDEIEGLVSRELAGSPLFAATFREAAGRALLLPRRRPGHRTPLWMQRKRSADLLTVASRYPSFPILHEAYRECLKDLFDLPALVDLARQVQARKIRLLTVDALVPSPFSSSLLFGYIANYLYDGDAPVAERRAQALLVDPRQLRELLGEAELRDLLDPAVLAEVEARLQAQDPRHAARSADRLQDLLLRLGDLSLAEITTRVEPPSAARGFLDELLAGGRAIAVSLGGEERFAAAEDAGALRDAFGTVVPRDLPDALLEPVAEARTQLVARYARTHGPFLAADLARRTGLEEVAVLATLEVLEERGHVVAGAFRPHGAGEEWCDAEVLASLRRLSLARARREVEPAEPASLGLLLGAWQGLTLSATERVRPGPEALLEVVEQLQGAAVPASVLEQDVLPARLPAYRPQDLDVLCAAGEVLWLGRGPLGERDGWVALYLSEDLPFLRPPEGERCDGDLHGRIRDHLHRRGASFFSDIHAALGGLPTGVLQGLWDLVWTGEVVNDSPVALRAFLAGGERRRRPARSRLAFRSRRDAPGSGLGRWSLAPNDERGVSSTERAAALAEQLLLRHGVLTRDAIVAEGVPGGFAALYPVLRGLEESGRVRRGYFIQGLGASQFAHPGALDRLRAVREPPDGDPPGVVLAATDPANPFGAALPWPKSATSRPQRVAGAHVVLVGGALAAYVTRGGGELLTFLPDSEPGRSRAARSLALALAGWLSVQGRGPLGWNTADGVALAETPAAKYLLEAGFVRWGPGFRWVGEPPPRPTRD